MAKKDTIHYKDDAMEEFVKDYQSCVDLLGDIITLNKSAKNNFDISYDGEGKEITDAAFDKCEQHLNLLTTCCSSMHDFVNNAWDTMKNADDSVAVNSEGRTK